MGILTLILQTIKSFFDSNTAVAKVVEKTQPSPEVQKDMYEMKKPRLEAGEMKRILREAKHYMFLNRKEAIDNHVELVYGHLEEEDKEELKAALHQAFPKHK